MSRLITPAELPAITSGLYKIIVTSKPSEKPSMKTAPFILLVTVFTTPAPLAAQAFQSSSPAITDRGPHHRIWSRTNIIALPNDRFRTNTSSFTELGSGMHRWNAQAGAWADADPTIEIVGNSAVASKAAHQVTFAANANTAGCIDLVTPDGKRLRSHVLGTPDSPPVMHVVTSANARRSGFCRGIFGQDARFSIDA